MPRFIFFKILFTLTTILQSLIFSGDGDKEREKLEDDTLRQKSLLLLESLKMPAANELEIFTRTPQTSPISILVSYSWVLPKKEHEVLSFLERMNTKNPEALIDLFNFYQNATSIKDHYITEIDKARQSIENCAREALRHEFLWGSIVVNSPYEWQSEDALVAKNNKYSYLPLAFEVAKLIENNAVAKFLRADVNLDAFIPKLNVTIKNCEKSLSDIVELEKRLEIITNYIPAQPKNFSHNHHSVNGDYF